MAAPPRSREDASVREKWYRRGARVSASSSIYHLGLDLFCLAENLSQRGRARQVFALLALRDAVCAVRLGTSGDVAATTRKVTPTVLATDLLALRVLRHHLPHETVPYDRSLSQFGLAAGWATQFANLPLNVARAGGLASPLLFQAAVARTFQFKGRMVARYLLAEGVWSAVALFSVGELVRSVRRSVDRGQAAAETNVALRLTQARLLAEHQAREYGSHSVFRKASSEFKGWVEVVEADSAALASRLADAEAERLRTFPEPGTFTADSLPLLIAALASSDEKRVAWIRVGGTAAGSNPFHTRSTDTDRVRSLIERILDIPNVDAVHTATRIMGPSTVGILSVTAVDGAGTALLVEEFEVVAGGRR